MQLDTHLQIDPVRQAAALSRQFADAPAVTVLATGMRHFKGRIALVSSFGAETAVLLHMTAHIDRHIPVIFIDTMMLFEETLEYQTALAASLGLTDVRRIQPDAAALRARDPYDALHLRDTDACCALRKIAPLENALEGFDATISGRKRHQSRSRANMPLFEADPSGRIKVNPLAAWSPEQVRDYAGQNDLPPHPLVKKGFLSIGCLPCTTPVGANEDPRSGRWRGTSKDECGIHFDPVTETARRIA